ncbi:hypothetical protein ACHMW5_13790 [Azospirillum melinis]|uniref:hypothetical protein n=1 Tax=Azospirillum melinis TaxID=328839 RepID=UPI003757763E
MTDTDKHNTSLTALIQLPDGNWIDPARVVGVEYVPPSPEIGGIRGTGGGNRVRVEFASYSKFVKFGSEKDAISCRDDLARQVNAAKAEARHVISAALKEASHG